MNRREYAHHTRDQIVGYLRDAVAIVDEADLPPDLTEAAFTETIKLLASKQIFMEEVRPGLGTIVAPNHRG